MKSVSTSPQALLTGPSDATWFRTLLPENVVVIEGLLSTATGHLFAQESAAVRNAIAKRQHEFAAGRFMAHAALATLLGKAACVPMADDRSPRWPSGVTGSITHTNTAGAVAVTRTTDWASVGIDMEEVTRVDTNLARMICTPPERALALPLALVFSAKESMYKCVYPLTRQWMDFGDAEITATYDTPTAGRFTASLTRPCGRFAQGHGFEGRWSETNGIIATALCCCAASDAV